jgi:hypothetical protein
VETGPIAADQQSWAGFHVTHAAPLPGDRVLLSVTRYTPRPSPALFVFDAGRNEFSFFADADPDIRDPSRLFYARAISPDAVVAVHFSGRTRKAAEIYYNRFNHLALFTPRYPAGIEVLKLGIDDGNVEAWTVRDRTLHLHTRDGRDPQRVRDRYWSLDLSQFLES